MGQNPVIRIVIVDAQKVVRQGLRTFLRAYPDLQVLGEAATAEEALAQTALHQPDVLLIDLMRLNGHHSLNTNHQGINGNGLTDANGAALIEALRAQHPPLQVVIFTSFAEEEWVEAALRAGAISYLLKESEPSELAEALRRAHAGLSTLAPEAAQALIHAHMRPTQPGYDLTCREREVLQAMAYGANNQTIAKQLGISYFTVKFHVSNILTKLAAASRTEAVAIALQAHILNFEG